VEEINYLLHDGDLQAAVGFGSMLEGVIFSGTDQDFAREARHVIRASLDAAGRTPEEGDEPLLAFRAAVEGLSTRCSNR
jgi:hypothetical protein